MDLRGRPGLRRCTTATAPAGVCRTAEGASRGGAGRGQGVAALGNEGGRPGLRRAIDLENDNGPVLPVTRR